MKHRNGVWVSPRGNQWVVQRENSDRASSVHNRKSDALDHGNRTARNEGVELTIQRGDGRIQDKNSFGNDPFPPRDKH